MKHLIFILIMVVILALNVVGRHLVDGSTEFDGAFVLVTMLAVMISKDIIYRSDY